MEQNLRGLFDRALEDEPQPPPGELAREAMVTGRRMRFHRRLLAGAAAAVAVVAFSTAGTLLWQSTQPPVASPGVIAAQAPLAPRKGCTAPVEFYAATDVSIFLTAEATDEQRDAIIERLDGDPRVRTWTFESRAQAYEKFKELWRDSPDFVESVAPAQLPESFRVQMIGKDDSVAFEREMRDRDGVEDVVGSACP